MLDQLHPIAPDAEPYASAEDLSLVDDLVEQDVKILRWHRNGKPLKLRVKALDLEQQDAINTGALKKNPKTSEWETHLPTFYALTIQYGVITPRLTPEQAQGMRKKNPNVVRALSDFIWALAAFDSDYLEATALALAPPPTTDTDAPPPAAGGDPPSED